MDTLIPILAILAGIIGIAGSILPGLPGTPISWVGLLILYICDMVSLVDSLVAPLSGVNALIVGVTAKRSVELARRLDALENIWSDYDVYEKRTDRV